MIPFCYCKSKIVFTTLNYKKLINLLTQNTVHFQNNHKFISNNFAKQVMIKDWIRLLFPEQEVVLHYNWSNDINNLELHRLSGLGKFIGRSFNYVDYISEARYKWHIYSNYFYFVCITFFKLRVYLVRIMFVLIVIVCI